MAITQLEARIKRAEQVLAAVARGELQSTLELTGDEDALTSLEMGINFLIMDLRAVSAENQVKEGALVSRQRELQEKLETIERQQESIRELSTPIMQVWDNVLVLPIVGVVDTHRSQEIMHRLLESIVQSQNRCVILDITGVEVVDTRTADYLLKVVQAAQLLGAHCVLTGIHPAVAQTLVEIGADLTRVKTLRNLKAGLQECLRHLGADAARVA